MVLVAQRPRAIAAADLGGARVDRPASLGDRVSAYDGGGGAEAFAPDGRTPASGREDDARLWDVRHQDRARSFGAPLRGHGDTVTSVAYGTGRAPVGHGFGGATARLWHVADPARARAGAVLPEHEQAAMPPAHTARDEPVPSGYGPQPGRRPRQVQAAVNAPSVRV